MEILDDDGVVDIVIVTWDDNIYALDAFGNIKPGFPVTSTNRFNCAPTLADLDGNGTLEIIAGNDSGYSMFYFMMDQKCRHSIREMTSEEESQFQI